MRILPDGQVEITNGDTGEKRVVSPNELTNYGIDPIDYTKAVAVTSAGAPVRTYGAPSQGASAYKPTAPQISTQPSATTQTTTPTVQKPLTLDEKKAKLRAMGYAEADINKAFGVQTSTQTPPAVPEKKKGIVESISNFIAPRMTGLAKQAINVPGMGIDLLQYKMAKTPEEKRKQLIEYNQKYNIVNEDQKKYGFDMNKSSGQQFSPTKYATGTTKGALELGSLTAPGGSGVKGMAVAGALSGSARGASEGDSFDINKMATGALVGGVVGGAFGAISKGLGMLKGNVSNTASKEFNKASPSVFRKTLEDKGLDVNTLSSDLVKKYNMQGMGYDEILGSASTRGKGGALGEALSNAENVIQSRVKDSKVVIPGDGVIANLEQQLGKMTGRLGEEPKRVALQKVIDEAKIKYANGVTPEEAMRILREANKQFGKNIVSVDPGEAVASAAQKVEADSLKKVLKAVFPDIAGALDEQSNILTLRPILNHARASLSTQGSTIRKGLLSSIDLTKPFTLLTGPVESALQNPNIATRVMGLGKPGVSSSLGKVPGVLGGIVGAKLAGNGQDQKPNGITTQIEDTKANGIGDIQGNNIDQHTGSLPSNPQGVNMQNSGTTYATGQSPEYWNSQYQQAMQQSPIDEVTAKYALEQRDYEATYQKANGPTKPKALSVAGSKEVSRNQTALNDIRALETILQEDPTKLLQSAVPGSLGARKYRALWGGIIDTIGTNRTGATYTPEQRKDYAHLLPMIGDTPEESRYKIARAKAEIENFLNNVSTSVPDIYQDPGLGATPPSL